MSNRPIKDQTLQNNAQTAIECYFQSASLTHEKHVHTLMKMKSDNVYKYDN